MAEVKQITKVNKAKPSKTFWEKLNSNWGVLTVVAAMFSGGYIAGSKWQEAKGNIDMVVEKTNNMEKVKSLQTENSKLQIKVEQLESIIKINEKRKDQ